MTAKIEPWMKLAAEHIEDAYTVAIQQQVVGTEPAVVEVAYIIAAHAPKQDSFESTEWFREEIERLERLLREQAPKETGIKPDNAQAAIKQEPSVPVGRLKLALVTATDLANDILYLIHQAEEINGK